MYKISVQKLINELHIDCKSKSESNKAIQKHIKEHFPNLKVSHDCFKSIQKTLIIREKTVKLTVKLGTLFIKRLH